ncbi:MAG: MFS transporter [Propionicimonas sp.]
MASFTKSLKNTSYLQSSVTILLFFASWGIWWSFFQIWLTNTDHGLGLNGAQVGTVYSVNSLATLIIMFIYGTVQDRLGIKRHLAIVASVVMTLVAPFMIWVYEPLLTSNFMVGVVIGAVVLSTGYMAAAGLMEALAERFSRRYGFEYGQARMWGSFGYAMVALVAGFLFTIDPHLNFWVGSAFGLLCLLVLLLWKNTATPVAGHGDEEASTPGVREMVGLLKMPALWLIIVFVLFSWTFYTVFDQQMFPEFYTNLFPTQEQGQQVYGILNSVQVFAEAAMMGVIPIVMRKVGVRTTLLIGVSVMFLRITGCSLLHDPIAVSAVKMLHALEVPLFILPIFRYFTLHFNPALSATLYMVGFQISAQIGNVLMSQPLGSLRDSIGYQPTFMVIAGTVLVAGIYAFFVLKKDDQDVLGEPFIRDAAKSAA